MQIATTTTTKEDAIGIIVEKRETIAPGQESSFEIAENAKGEPKITVKVYNPDAGEMIDEGIASYRAAKLKLAALLKELAG